MSSASSSSHEPSPAPVKPKKSSKEKSKKKAKKAATVVLTQHGKNEGENPNWAFQPPPGAVLADHEVDSGEFDWNAVKDDEDVELWLLRVPEDVRSYLSLFFRIKFTTLYFTEARLNQNT
jgi:hypothetical protein